MKVTGERHDPTRKRPHDAPILCGPIDNKGRSTMTMRKIVALVVIAIVVLLVVAQFGPSVLFRR
jgi:hypothetical protein